MDDKNTENIISYSQFRIWNTCPFQWSKIYIDKIKDDYPNVELIFGTGMHESIQTYTTGLYEFGPKHADQINIKDILRNTMGVEYKKSRDNLLEKHVKRLYKESDEKLEIYLNKYCDQYIPKESMIEYYNDGIKIINYFIKNRREFFNSVDEELIAIEFPIEKRLRNNLIYKGYIDILIRNKKTGKYRIIDLKTSKKGWNSYKKSDDNTTNQLVLYKIFYSDVFNIDPNKIDVEYIIMKRKLFDDIPYKQKRMLKYIPPSGKPTMNKVKSRFNDFVEFCFNENGNYNTNIFYPKIPTKSNCMFCMFSNRPDICDKINK